MRPEALLHISLNGVGAYKEVPPSVERAAMQAGARVHIAPFEISLCRAMSFSSKGRHPFVLTAGSGRDEVALLRSAIGAQLRTVGFRWRDSTHYLPHLTVLYSDDVAPAVELPEPISWIVRDFVLVRSLIGRSRHIHCADWPLLPH